MKSTLLFLSVLILSLFVVNTTNAMPKSEYTAKVSQTLQLVERAATGGDRQSTYLRRARLMLVQLEKAEVTVDGQSIHPDLRYIEERLAQSPPDVQRAKLYLQALVTELNGENTSSMSSVQQGALEKVLADPRFQPYKRNPLQEQINRFLAWLAKHLPKINSNPMGPTSTSPFSFARALVIAVSVALVAGAAWFLLRTSRNFSRQKRAAGRRTGLTTPQQMIEDAGRSAREGDYRQAVRLYFMAVLLTLNERGQIRYLPPLTNREHLREIQTDLQLRSSFAPLVNIFDDVWYGNVPVTREQYDAYAAQARKLTEDQR